jgi:hypothetical protein
LDETTFRILETLAENMGQEMSIKTLTEAIQRFHGSAHYSNIYNKVQQMSKDKMITLNKAGNTYRISLNFYDYWIVDLLTQMEIMKKQKLLIENPRILQLFSEIEKVAQTITNMSSISAIRLTRNEAVNRLELLVLFKDGISSNSEEKTRRLTDYAIDLMQRVAGAKVDSLLLNESEFGAMLSSKEKSPAREMIGDKLSFFGTQNFWLTIKSAVEKGIWVRAERQETIPSKISEEDLVYNMARFGYKELGKSIKLGTDFSVEFVVAGMLAKGQARLVEAVPVILAKQKANYNVLFFLAQKFHLLDLLLAVLEALSVVLPRDKKAIGYLIQMMKKMNIKTTMILNTNSIEEKIRFYKSA